MRYRFHDYSLDSDRRELRRDEHLLTIEPKIFQVFLYLLEHRDRVLSKDELLEQCWPDTFVSESALNRCLTRLRKAVQGERASPQVIKTLHRQGYRFIAEVTALSDECIDTDRLQETTLPQKPSPETPEPLQSSPTPAVPKSQLSSTAERRQLTVLFCDLVSSTSLSDQLDPEDLHEVLNAYHTACAEVIERFEGHVAQSLGDGLLVYFGYPRAYEDAGRRSVHTGLGIVNAMRALNDQLEKRHGVRPAVRIGIHTGLVVVADVGTGGRVEQLAVGVTPNLAARLQGLAAPDSVVVSAETYHLIQGYFTFEELGAHALTGVAEPQEVYRVIEERGAQSRLDVASVRGLTPFVGREIELALLLDRWGQGQALKALDVARRQPAKSFELRAATSPARLWQSQDKRQDAYDLLAPVYGWFTEGFDTADLVDAKALLDKLSEDQS